MKAQIAVLPGDGIGPEVVAEATRVLRAIGNVFHHDFVLAEALIGGAAIDATGLPLPDDTLALCRASDAALLGAVGGPKWDAPAKLRPEQGLLAIRRGLGLFANVRPVQVQDALRDTSTIKPEVLQGVDIVVIRELTGGIYFGEKWRKDGTACDTCTYSEDEIARVVRVAASFAMGRKRTLCSVDKANVLETSRLWREVTEWVCKTEFPEIQLRHMLVDACAMQLIKRPREFDVIVTENMFGDILTDEAAMLAGSIGMLPSASLREDRFGLYEPIHGSAPDIAGLGIANPYGTLASVAMLLRHSLQQETAAQALERAITEALAARIWPADMTTHDAARTREVGDAVIARIRSPQ